MDVEESGNRGHNCRIHWFIQKRDEMKFEQLVSGETKELTVSDGYGGHVFGDLQYGVL